MDNKKIIFWSILDSLGVLLYVAMVVTFMSNAQAIFGKADNVLAGIIMLMVFILSALITGSLVLGRPIFLFLNGQKNEGIKMLICTAICLFALLLLAILTMLAVKKLI